MYAVFDKNHKFISFQKEIPDVPLSKYFMYSMKEANFNTELCSAYLENAKVMLYLDGYKLVNMLKSKNIFIRIHHAICKYRSL